MNLTRIPAPDELVAAPDKARMLPRHGDGDAGLQDGIGFEQRRCARKDASNEKPMTSVPSDRAVCING